MSVFFIKLGTSILCLLLFVLTIVVGNKLAKAQTDQLRDVSGSFARALMYQILMMLTMFVVLWLLARLFPISLFPVLFGALILGIILQVVLGSITGVSLPETKKKINALSVIWSAHKPAMGCAFLAASMIYVVVSPIGALIVFWAYPIADPAAQVWVTFFVFIFPVILIMPAAIPLAWSVTTSQYLDDDVRNSTLISAFSSIFYRSVFLLFPFWLIGQELPNVFGIPAPSYGVLLTIPVSFFVLGYLIPFFLGVYRFRSQTKIMLDWRKSLLQNLFETSKLEIGSDLRNERLDATITRLTEELDSQSSKNELLNFYMKLDTAKEEAPDQELLLHLEDDDDEMAEAIDAAPSQEFIPADEEIPERGVIKSRIKATREIIRGVAGPDIAPPATAADVSENIEAIVRENRSKLVEWDLRFSHLNRILDLIEVAEEGKNKDISGFVEASLEKHTGTLAAPQSRNVIAGLVLSVISGLGALLVKSYEDTIVGFIATLVGSG